MLWRVETDVRQILVSLLAPLLPQRPRRKAAVRLAESDVRTAQVLPIDRGAYQRPVAQHPVAQHPVAQRPVAQHPAALLAEPSVASLPAASAIESAGPFVRLRPRAGDCDALASAIRLARSYPAAR